MSSAATTVLMPAAVWTAPVEDKLAELRPDNSLILTVFTGSLCAFGKYVFGMFCKKKNRMSNLNSVKKEFTCCLHLAGGGPLNSGGSQDVILLYS